MPPSRYPTIADGTLVPEHDRGDGVSDDSRQTVTRASVHPLLDYDLGPHFNYQDASGVLTAPAEGQAIAAAARRQGRCGRQRSGRHQVAAADGAARHLHRMERDGVGSAQGASRAASAAASSRSRRRRPNGSRAAIRGRRSRSAIARTTNTCRSSAQAAAKLVQERYLLQQDADAMIAQAAASDVLRAPGLSSR